jgi:hypothetical protein
MEHRMKKITWEMRVAVISTIHMPPGYEGSGLHFTSADHDTGPIVYIEDNHEAPDWLIELSHHINAGLKTPYDWIRFDSGADPVPGAHTFDWE